MNILLTGASGYIGSSLLPHLLEKGHRVIVLLRPGKKAPSGVEVIEGDLLDPVSLKKIPKEIDAAYYLVHSMAQSSKGFFELEERSARNFVEALEQTRAKQVIYLSGLSHGENLSLHFASRKNVEKILQEGKIPVTVLKSSIIIGKGSASFQIIQDLVRRLPVMITPKWLHQLTQPISVENVMEYLTLVLGHEKCLGKTFEIGGPDVLSYKGLLLRVAELQHLKRWIFTVPVLTPKLSAYWLYFVTSASYLLAATLIESLKTPSVCEEESIQELFPIRLFSFDESVKKALRAL